MVEEPSKWPPQWWAVADVKMTLETVESILMASLLEPTRIALLARSLTSHVDLWRENMREQWQGVA